MWRELFRFFSSLKLAVFSILLLATVLAVATFLESYFGTRAAHVAVYGTAWFGGVLVMLGANVLCAALSRYPWKRHQTGFVLTHLGIIVLIVGSFLTQQFGVDGNLPVTEGLRGNEVILPDPELSVQDESSGLELGLRVPETVRASAGKLMSIHIPGDSNLVLTQFVPRAQFDRRFVKSELPGVGMAAVKVEIYNDRFRLDEWLTTSDPVRPAEVNLGPAILSLERLWNEGDEKTFYSPPKIATPPRKGTLVVGYQGKEYRLVLTDGMKGWQRLSSSGLELELGRYLPYAVVEKNELVSKSPEPKNPAVQLRIRKGEGEPEKHTVFAYFPEFPTLHGKSQKKETLGVTVRFLAGDAEKEKLMGVGNRRGRLRFAVSPDSKSLLYSVLAASGTANSKGVVSVGQEMETGWMDLKFKVEEWIPYAVESLVPIPIEYISGSGDNYLSAVEVGVERGDNISDRFWLFEGTGRKVTVGSRSLDVNYTRKRMFLPFEIELQKFTVGMDPGTTRAASYESRVFVRDPQSKEPEAKPESTLISMNSPLDHDKYTFYQASYQMEEGKAPISIFSVNYDPGRVVKYLGSIIMVLGILLMFYMNPHYWDVLLGRKH